MNPLFGLLTVEIFKIPGGEITLLKLIIFSLIITAFYLFSRYISGPLVEKFLEKIGIEEEDQNLLSKAVKVSLMLVGIAVGVFVIGIQILVFLNTVIFTFKTVEVKILDVIFLIVTLIAVYLVSSHIVTPLLSKILEKMKIKKENRKTLLKSVHYLIILGGFYLGFRFFSAKLLTAALSITLVVFTGVKITPFKIIMSILTVVIIYLVSKYLITTTLDKILKWVGTEEDDRNTLVNIFHALIVTAGIFVGINTLGLKINAILFATIFKAGGAEITVMNFISLFIIILISYLISKFVIRTALNKIMKEGGIKEKNRETALNVIHYFILGMGIYIAVNTIGFQLTSLLAVAGVTGIILGFGLQPLISNLVSGFLLMGERTVRIGDWVEFDGMYGVVVDTGIRASTIRTIDNRHLLIPNRSFVDSPFTNYSHKDSKIRISASVGVAYGTDVEKVKDILLNIAEDNKEVLELPEPRVFFTEFGDSSLNFELACWISDPKYRKRTLSKLNYKINKRFSEEGITIPFPQRDVNLRRKQEMTEEKVEEEENL
ncbi:hypothetical protein AKJ51_04570 [candidate division MSBL1 archaeon SCGC-AAA382A20]|uniref:Mechanosensitive ion channel protein n=1 Tax=candidate division MSBL1 archaeon SCGC-AAA382A20 TaxID=1698280 RepID=A0A133VHG4_9EURY|nr:hypothetical protein AKJ51_04570 [candidate division MSBL1 archaeon SCGC-AAA382A20]